MAYGLHSIMFATVLQQFLEERGYSAGQVARLAGLPKTSIVNWLDGRVIRPRHWEPLAQLGRALRLTTAEFNHLLTAAQHPTLPDLWPQITTPAQRALLEFWHTPTMVPMPALTHARQQGQDAPYAALLRPLIPLWLAQGLYDQALHYLDWPPTQPALLTLFRGQIARHQQQYTAARQLLRQGLRHAPAGSWEQAALLVELGIVAHCVQETATAERLFQQALLPARAAPYPDLLATMAEERGNAALLRHEDDTAAALYREGLAHTAAYPAGTILLHKSLGALHLLQGDLATAEQYLNTGLNLAYATSHHMGQALLLNNLAAVAMHQEAWPVAHHRLTEARHLAIPLAHPKLSTILALNEGVVAYQLGDITAALAHFTAAQQGADTWQLGSMSAKAARATAALSQGRPLPPITPSLML